MYGKSNMETYISICKIDSQWEFAVWLRKLKTGALYQPRGVGSGGRWEGGSKAGGYMYTYGWVMLRFDRKQQNSVMQLSFNKKETKWPRNSIPKWNSHTQEKWKHIHKTPCTPMFRVALLTVTKSKNTHPPPDGSTEWINRMWSFYKQDCHSALKTMKHFMLWHEAASKTRCWVKEDRYRCMIPSVWNVQDRQIQRDRRWVSSCSGLQEEGWEVTANQYRISFWGDGSVPELDSGDGWTTLWIY